MFPSAVNVCIRKLLSIEYTRDSDCSVMMAWYDIPCADHFNSWMQWHHHHHHRTAVEWCMNGVIIWLHSAVTCMAPCYSCSAHDNVDIFSRSLQSNPYTICICVVFCMWTQREKVVEWGKGGNFFVCIWLPFPVGTILLTFTILRWVLFVSLCGKLVCSILGSIASDQIFSYSF